MNWFTHAVCVLRGKERKKKEQLYIIYFSLPVGQTGSSRADRWSWRHHSSLLSIQIISFIDSIPKKKEILFIFNKAENTVAGSPHLSALRAGKAANPPPQPAHQGQSDWSRGHRVPYNSCPVLSQRREQNLHPELICFTQLPVPSSKSRSSSAAASSRLL